MFCETKTWVVEKTDSWSDLEVSNSVSETKTQFEDDEEWDDIVEHNEQLDDDESDESDESDDDESDDDEIDEKLKTFNL